MHPQPLQLAGARKLLQSRIATPRPSAHTLRPARLRGRRARPPHIHLTGWPARPASSAGTGRQRSMPQPARQLRPPRPCRHTAYTQPTAPLGARSQPPPPSPPHKHLDSRGGRRGCPRHRPLGLAACASRVSSTPSLHPWPHRARTAIERRRRRGRCAPGTAGRGVCRACLPDARVALAARRRPCAPSTRGGRGGRVADAAPRARRASTGRRPMASSGARRRGGRCPDPLLRTRLRRPRYQQGVRLARGPVGLSARGRGAARLSLRLSAQPRVPVLERGIRALAQAQAAILHSTKQKHAMAAPWHDEISSAVTGWTPMKQPCPWRAVPLLGGMSGALYVMVVNMGRHARQRSSAHLPDAQRQGRPHGGLPFIAARLVQRGQPLLGCRLRLSARLGASLVHLGRGYCLISRAMPFMERQACV